MLFFFLTFVSFRCVYSSTLKLIYSLNTTSLFSLVYFKGRKISFKTAFSLKSFKVDKWGMTTFVKQLFTSYSQKHQYLKNNANIYLNLITALQFQGHGGGGWRWPLMLTADTAIQWQRQHGVHQAQTNLKYWCNVDMTIQLLIVNTKHVHF